MRKHLPSFLALVKHELFSKKSLLIYIIIGVVYAVFSVSILNYRLVLNTFVGNFPFVYKATIFLTIIEGAWTGLSHLDFFLLLLNSLLVGVNIFLLIRTIYSIGHAGKRVRFTIGGATIISLITTGCTSCGLSLLSILGLSASLSFFPYHGLELHIGAILLLIISAVYMLKQLWNAKYCSV